MREAANFSMIEEQDLSAKEGLWCQSDINNTKNTGVWYIPNGTKVTNNIHLPVNVSYASGQIGLFRINGISTYQGLFTCVIQDQYDTTNQTLVVAIYSTAEYGLRSNNFGTGLPFFKLLSSRDFDSPVFTISFNVTDRPPTNVTCMRSEQLLMISESDVNRVILSGKDPINVTVIVTFRTREPGEYVCIATAANQNPSMTSAVVIEVLETPENLTQIRTDFDSVIVNWKFPGRMNQPSGYEVFYETGNNSRQSIESDDTIVSITLEGDQNYTVFIVAYGTGPSLPSEPSEALIITQVLSFIIDGPSEAHSVSDNVTLYCETKNFIEMIEISLIWIDVNDLKTNSSDNFIISELSTNNMVLSELQIRGIPLVQAGIYTCEATVTFNEISQKISRTHPVEVQAPAPLVDVSIKAITN